MIEGPTGSQSGHENNSSRFRLYVDESGDHVYRHLDRPSHRYLALIGCWFSHADYFGFHQRMVQFKNEQVPHHPDDPPVLHREDIINRRGHFKHLQDDRKAQAFDDALLELIEEAEFRIVCVVTDKQAMREKYGDAAAHPYPLALGFLLQRYCGYLNHINRTGDVMAESRGTQEDRLLAGSYSRTYAQGAWMVRAERFQKALTSSQLKFKKKIANIAGLQLADVLAHPVRQSILKESGLSDEVLSPFGQRLMPIVERKWNRHVFDERVWGYGKVLFPKK